MSDRVKDLHVRSNELAPMIEAYVEVVNVERQKRIKQSAVLREMIELGLMAKVKELPKAAARKVLDARGPEDRGVPGPPKKAA